MKVSIFGLGYVGSVTAAGLVKLGHEVVGLDSSPQKRDLMAQGRGPVLEPGLEEEIRAARAVEALTVSDDTVEAVRSSDISMICVGTPSDEAGDVDLSALRQVVEEIGEALAGSQRYHVVCIRSTVPPGTCEGVVEPILAQSSNRRSQIDFGVSMNPEFLREGSSLKDFFDPPFVIVGHSDERCARSMTRLYSSMACDVIETSLRTAELLKYCCNVFHALKVVFANEMAVFAQSEGVDGRELMELLCRDKKLNISEAYLRPGYAFGGSCLPKDLRAIVRRGRASGLELPVLEAIQDSNRLHADRGVAAILRSQRKKVGILGLAFKSGTDDLRESPMVYVAEQLLGKGLDLFIYDQHVRTSMLCGKNKAFVEKAIPHLARLLKPSIEEVLAHAEVLVLGSSDASYTEALTTINGRVVVVDLAGLSNGQLSRTENYVRIC